MDQSSKCIRDAACLMSLDEGGDLMTRITYARHQHHSTSTSNYRVYTIQATRSGVITGSWDKDKDGDLPFIVVGRRSIPEIYPLSVKWINVDEFMRLGIDNIATGGNRWMPMSVSIVDGDRETIVWDVEDDEDDEEEDDEDDEDDDEDDDEEEDEELERPRKRGCK